MHTLSNNKSILGCCKDNQLNRLAMAEIEQLQVLEYGKIICQINKQYLKPIINYHNEWVTVKKVVSTVSSKLRKIIC